ncbi:MAG: fimbrillin family protein [Candidatus Cryptobacteroides sp.]
MTIEAVFTGGVSAGENTYVAVYNSANDLQILYKEAYTEDADILVSKAISSFDESIAVQLQFKREVAIAKMTLKGLDAGEVVNHISVSSTADIAGSYGVDGWNSTKTSLDIYSELAMGESEGYSIVANASGEAVVWFTCIPQDAATLTVKVEAADGDTYTKEFSRPISLSQGDVNTFGVAMVKDAKVTPSYTIEFNNESSSV